MNYSKEIVMSLWVLIGVCLLILSNTETDKLLEFVDWLLAGVFFIRAFVFSVAKDERV